MNNGAKWLKHKSILFLHSRLPSLVLPEFPNRSILMQNAEMDKYMPTPFIWMKGKTVIFCTGVKERERPWLEMVKQGVSVNYCAGLRQEKPWPLAGSRCGALEGGSPPLDPQTPKSQTAQANRRRLSLAPPGMALSVRGSPDPLAFCVGSVSSAQGNSAPELTRAFSVRTEKKL